MSHLIAAIDESLRRSSYLLCATVVSTAARHRIRQQLRGLLLPNQRRLHAKHESSSRKRALLKSLADIEETSCHVVIGHRRRDGARELCLGKLASQLVDVGVCEMLLERVDHGTTKIDERIMAQFMSRQPRELEWRHEDPAHEPLLWISDLVASAYGAGGELRAIAVPLIATVTTIETVGS